jgi:hypothetical protein
MQVLINNDAYFQVLESVKAGKYDIREDDGKVEVAKNDADTL